MKKIVLIIAVLFVSILSAQNQKTSSVFKLTIDAKTTDAEISQKISDIESSTNLKVEIKNLKRNNDNQIITYSFSYDDNQGNSGSKKVKQNTPIDDLEFTYISNSSGKSETNITTNNSKRVVIDLDDELFVNNFDGDFKKMFNKSFRKAHKIFIDEDGNVKEEVIEDDGDFNIDDILNEMDFSAFSNDKVENMMKSFRQQLNDGNFSFSFFGNSDGRVKDIEQEIQELKKAMEQIQQQLKEE